MLFIGFILQLASSIIKAGKFEVPQIEQSLTFSLLPSCCQSRKYSLETLSQDRFSGRSADLLVL
jgi:hypothetical protein